MISVYFIAKLGIFRILGVQKLRSHPDHEQLSDLLLDGHFAKSFLCPLFAVVIEMHGYGLVFSFGNGANGREEEQQEKHAANHDGSLPRQLASVFRRRCAGAAIDL